MSDESKDMERLAQKLAGSAAQADRLVGLIDKQEVVLETLRSDLGNALEMKRKYQEELLALLEADRDG